jgi:hypothetical protein
MFFFFQWEGKERDGGQGRVVHIVCGKNPADADRELSSFDQFGSVSISSD